MTRPNSVNPDVAGCKGWNPLSGPKKGNAMPRMLDLYSGTGSASRPFECAGWEVTRIDNNRRYRADIYCDITRLDFAKLCGPFDFIWASPPCTPFSTASRHRSLETLCVEAALKCIYLWKPRFWIIENVHGATTTFQRLGLGPPIDKYGSFYLWGVFPKVDVILPRNKTKLSGTHRAERRGMIPWELANALCQAITAYL